MFVGVTGGLVLAGLAVYLKVIRPAVGAAIAEADVEESERGDVLGGMPSMQGTCDRWAAEYYSVLDDSCRHATSQVARPYA
jgi:hypothetical protein